MRDYIAQPNVTTALLPAVRTADVNGAAVEVHGLHGATIVVATGAAGVSFDATDKIAFELEEADTSGGAYTDVAQADMFLDPDSSEGEALSGSAGQFAALDALADEAGRVFKVGYKGNKKFVRVVANYSGTHGTGTLIGALALRERPWSYGKQPSSF